VIDNSDVREAEKFKIDVIVNSKIAFPVLKIGGKEVK
jgi:hypothetical protein